MLHAITIPLPSNDLQNERLMASSCCSSQTSVEWWIRRSWLVLDASLEQVTVAFRDLVITAAREQVTDVQRVEVCVRNRRKLLRGALDAPGSGLQREQHDGAQKSHGAGKRLRHGAERVEQG